MAANESSRRARRRVIYALISLSLLLVLVTTAVLIRNVGSSRAGGVSTGGFSACCYSGNPDYDHQDMLHFGILDAHNGHLNSDHCSYDTARAWQFPFGASVVDSNNDTVEAFWFLTALSHGVNTCGFTGNAYQWGQAQATMFVYAVASSGFLGPVISQYADVEWHVDKGEPIDCAHDDTRWLCDSVSWNRFVILGFVDQIYALGGEPGIYSSGSQWQTLTGSVPASTIHNPLFWLALPGASQANLNAWVWAFQAWGYSIQSWQYKWTCADMSYATALNRAETAISQGFYVWRFDGWDADGTITVC